MHSYSVQLRISGGELDPESVSKLLELRPDQVRLKGAARGSRGAWPESMWSYGGRSYEVTREWGSLEEALLELLNELWPRRDLISALAQKFEVVWWCGHFQSSFDGGPTFSAALLQRLAQFGVPLYLDNYFCPDEEGRDNDIK